MSYIDTNVLARLADKDLDKAYRKAGMSSLPANILQALEAKMEKKREEAAGAAAEEIIKLYESSDDAIVSSVNSIRELRAQIKQHKKRLEKIARAKAYGAGTGNYLPLAKVLGFHTNVDDKSLLNIPEDWEPPVQPEI